jgi:hypothetical protein
MTPLHLSFRGLISRYIPQLTHEDVTRYESLVAFRHQLILEENFEPPQKDEYPQNDITRDKSPDDKSPNSGHSKQTPPRLIPNGLIRNVNKQANDIVRPFKKEYEAVVRLWNARRQVVVRQRHYGQIPDTAQRLKDLICAMVKYRWVQIRTFPILLKNRIKFYVESLSPKGILFIMVLVILVYLGLRALTSPNEKPQPNGSVVVPPDSTVQPQPAPVDSSK